MRFTKLIRNVRKFAQVTILHVSHSSFEAKQARGRDLSNGKRTHQLMLRILVEALVSPLIVEMSEMHS